MRVKVHKNKPSTAALPGVLAAAAFMVMLTACGQRGELLGTLVAGDHTGWPRHLGRHGFRYIMFSSLRSGNVDIDEARALP